MLSTLHVEIEFNTYYEAVDHVRWLRKNLHNRGDDWDFCFSKKGNKLDIVISDPKIATWYRLAFPKAKVR